MGNDSLFFAFVLFWLFFCCFVVVVVCLFCFFSVILAWFFIIFAQVRDHFRPSQGPVSRKSGKFFGPENLVGKLPFTSFEKRNLLTCL